MKGWQTCPLYRILHISVLYFCIFMNSALGAHQQANAWPADFKEDSVKSTKDGTTQHFYYRSAISISRRPLVVSLHQWGSDYRDIKNALALETKVKNWNYIHPDFRGPNKRPESCNSSLALQDIDDAINWALQNMPVDSSRIYVIGASGGGMAALGHFMTSSIKINTYIVFVPVTDLENWYSESLVRNKKYASDILACTSSPDTLNKAEAVARSPLHQPVPLLKLPYTVVKIFAGVHDGYTGSVPITHSIFFYNKLLKALGEKKSGRYVSDQETITLLSRQSYPNSQYQMLGDRRVHLYKKSGNISITLFEGGHEILVGPALEQFDN